MQTFDAEFRNGRYMMDEHMKCIEEGYGSFSLFNEFKFSKRECFD